MQLTDATGFAQRSYERLLELPGWFLDGGNRLYWVYLLVFVLLGTLAWLVHYRGTADAPRSLAGFLFPRSVYCHPSARIDYQLLLCNRMIGPSSLLARVLLGSASVAAVGTLTQQWLIELAGPGFAPREWTFGMLLGFVLVNALVWDLATYVTHAAHHRFPLLWEFHKVHHSAEVLTPFTVYRKHPVYSLAGRVVDLALVGPFQGVVAFLFAGAADPLTLFGSNVIFALFHLLGSNLRHSHIWWSFGPTLSRILISPAQHQIHHSKAPQHWNRNYGEVFALWDWLFGTLYVPGPQREPLEFGIAGTEGQEHDTLLKAYLVPFLNCARILRARLAPAAIGRPLPADAARRTP